MNNNKIIYELIYLTTDVVLTRTREEGMCCEDHIFLTSMYSNKLKFGRHGKNTLP